jgi:hypothetical protein
MVPVAAATATSTTHRPARAKNASATQTTSRRYRVAPLPRVGDRRASSTAANITTHAARIHREAVTLPSQIRPGTVAAAFPRPSSVT